MIVLRADLGWNSSDTTSYFSDSFSRCFEYSVYSVPRFLKKGKTDLPMSPSV